MKSQIHIHLIAIGALVAVGAVLAIAIETPAQSRVATASAPKAPASSCDTFSCTVYLPLVARNYPPPTQIEIAQAIQQPDNPVPLIADRTTFARLTLTSTVAHADVYAYLHGSRNGAPLPGSPLSASNNPRTLKASVDRDVLEDTFNFELPASWLSGDIVLWATASNGSSYEFLGAGKTAHFTAAGPMHVTVIPIAYTCTSGGTGTTTPGAPYDYLIDFTYRIYPVPSITLATHAAMPYAGPCNGSGVPYPSAADWDHMLDGITDMWWNEGRPDSYYYGLIDIYCGGSCITGYGYIGWYKAAVGWSGIGPSHYDASETHAHEVGHNHGRWHAPGCGAGNPDPGYPYASALIGNSANPNYGFDVDDQTLYRYSSYYDIMSYCSAAWVSDYTYEALLAYDQAYSVRSSARAATYERALLVSGQIDPASGRVSLRPVYALDLPIALPEAGDHTLELLDASGSVLATYPFEPVWADLDRRGGTSSQRQGFHLALPYVDDLASIRVRREGAVLGQLEPGGHAPSLQAGLSALGGDGSAFGVTWSAVDPDGDPTHYLVRASTDGGASWQTIGVNLAAPAITLRPTDFGGQSVLVEVLASDGLHTTPLRLGPFEVPQ